MAIPKTIHYCWFGGKPLPKLAIKCINSWKKFCPNYKIKLWNEENFDLNLNKYVNEAYKAKRWAFVADVARLFAIVSEGGVYMDTDVEVIAPLDEFLTLKAFSGFENQTMISTGIMACEANHPLFAEFLSEYDNEPFIKPNGIYNVTTNVTRITNTCLKYGFKPNNTQQTVNGFTLFPTDYFCPKSWQTGITTLTPNTRTIHHFTGSWHSPAEMFQIKLRKKLVKIFPFSISLYLASIISGLRILGIKPTIKKINVFIQKRIRKAAF